MNTYKELRFIIMADRMMNRGSFKKSFIDFFKEFVAPDYIMDFLISLRKYSYFIRKNSAASKLLGMFYHYKNRRLGIKLGFSISDNAFGYGLVIPHYGTIVVGDGNQIGNYCVLHTSTCITAGDKKIGDFLYLSTGAKIINSVVLGNSISIGANAVVTKSFPEDNCLLLGIPAQKSKSTESWYTQDIVFLERVKKCENMKQEMNIVNHI